MVARWGGFTTGALLVAYDLVTVVAQLPSLPVGPHIDLFAVALVLAVWGSIRRFERITITPQREIWLHGVQYGREAAYEECGAQGSVVPLPLNLFASDLVPDRSTGRPASHRPSPRRRRAN